MALARRDEWAHWSAEKKPKQTESQEATKTVLCKRAGLSLKEGIALGVSGQEETGAGLAWGLHQLAVLEAAGVSG